MTTSQARQEGAGAPGSSPAPGESGPAKAPRRRLAGIDVARGIAVIGMFCAHFDPDLLNPDSWLQQLVTGRSAALFALLAGVSIALLSGGGEPAEGRAMRARRVQIAVRAVLLFVLGLALTSLGTTVKEILTVYAVLFLLSIPLLRVRPLVLAVAAAVLAVAGPLASFALRGSVVPQTRTGVSPGWADLTSAQGALEVLKGILLTGTYPVLTWLPFLLAGLAIGRLDLRARTVRLTMALAGAVLASAAYAASWAAMNPLGGYARIAGNLGGGLDVEGVRLMTADSPGTVPVDDPGFLFISASHSGAPLEILAEIGVAMVVISVSLVVADRFPRAVVPLASVGALALTGYAGHIVVIWAIGIDRLTVLATETGYLPLVVLVVATMVLTTVWRRFLGRGPLEALLARLSTAAGSLVRP
ncbi:hypothetical protein CFN78_11685 [Amycolatopsis antarctica]|uniref:Heparan-alpha-glucosaminide N-acetyltransferase catalytic domain-containing protein n=1 Tax=Amycolatopsis antarctica TaxID=1854586 RepID=A0A263D5P9_9PSEU|nr:heparan-alpha-glucosaminide N-acetyltransferase domain-containing protein [Amycolatopsis antarctica]OZM72917.1 hypothetical protein CFN78_11685 [Amycolatopsis antarctica]